MGRTSDYTCLLYTSKTVAIPNKEVSQEYVNAISTMDWNEVIHSVEASRKLLQDLWNMNCLLYTSRCV